MNPPHKILLIDGNSLFYRAFFTPMPAFTTASGMPTNAVYGLAMMLHYLLEKEKPESIMAAFDAPGRSFRYDRYEHYKATRQATPDDLKIQSPIARELVQDFNIPILEVPGCEADD